jgi:small-conductance mechanosensitive channel
MMINNNYALQVEQAKANNSSIVNFDNTTPEIQPIAGEKDTVTLSYKALAMMNGTEAKEVAPTYVRPETARALLAGSEAIHAANNTDDTSAKENKVIDTRFGEMMQSIIDQRLGVDRKKLDELEALMAEIAENENMSPEEKQKALEMLTQMRDKLIEESREIREVAKQTD